VVKYCESPFSYRHRASREVRVGNVGVGGNNPIRVQSMITCDTMDTAMSIQQTIELANVGCEIVRITAPTVKDSRNLENIVKGLREHGCDVPIVADIHFKPEAAMEAAKWVDKVRINPGNYADSKKFVIREYTDEQYAAELGRIRARYRPLVELCKERGIAMRIGTNHEPPVRLRSIAPARNYPVHLGVTEAGEGEDARVKSAIGNGSLLADGIGDTIRISLTEDSIHEIPVAKALVRLTSTVAAGVSPAQIAADTAATTAVSFDPFSYQRRATETLAVAGIGDPGRSIKLGGEQLLRVIVRKANFDKIAHKIDKMSDYKPEIVYENAQIEEVDPRDEQALGRLNQNSTPQFVTVKDDVDLPVIAAFRLLAT